MTTDRIFSRRQYYFVYGTRKEITPADNQRLFDVVEEMKIASALEKMPDVYIIDDPALNALLPAEIRITRLMRLLQVSCKYSIETNCKVSLGMKYLTSRTEMSD